MRKILLLLLILLTIDAGSVYGQDNAPDSVLIGSYVSSLNNFDIANNSISADIHLWCLYNDSTFDFEKELEFINCEDFTLNGISVDDLDEKKWFYTKALIESRQKYSTRNYPFDSQRIVFTIESSEYTTDDFVFVPDLKGSKLDSIVYNQFDEWQINNVEFSASETYYDTSFGDPEATSSASPRFDIIITISRVASWHILFKLITGIIVAFLISSCVFWIKPSNTDPRFGLCVGGLFAAIGNKYIVESIIPSTNELTLLDSLHNITFITIFIIIILSVISLHIYERDDEKNIKLSRRIDITSYAVLNIFYFANFAYLIYTYS
jgi:hypothetical protein